MAIAVGAMCAEAEMYGGEEVLIDDYLAFVTHFGSDAVEGAAANSAADPDEISSQAWGEQLPRGDENSPADQRRLGSLLEIEQSRRQLVEHRLAKSVSDLEEWTGAERQLAEDLLQAVAACEAELHAARTEGEALAKGWSEERRGFKAELEGLRRAWQEDSAEQRRLLGSLAEAVAAARVEKERMARQRSEMQAQLLELSAAHQKSRSDGSRCAA